MLFMGFLTTSKLGGIPNVVLQKNENMFFFPGGNRGYCDHVQSCLAQLADDSRDESCRTSMSICVYIHYIHIELIMCIIERHSETIYIYIHLHIYIHKRWSIFINSTYPFINSRSYVYHWYRPSPRGEPDDFVAVPPSSSAATLRGAGGGRAGERNWGVIGRVMFNEIPFNPMKFHTKNRLNIWWNMIKPYSTSMNALNQH